jgi:tetratricopeptide (TPR) repeat protein
MTAIALLLSGCSDSSDTGDATDASGTAPIVLALQEERWDDALALDPKNIPALSGRANASLLSPGKNIDGAFRDIAAIEAINSSAEGLPTLKSQAFAMKAMVFIDAGNLPEAQQAYQNAKQNAPTGRHVQESCEALRNAYIDRGQVEVGRKNSSVALAHADQAAALGADIVSVNSLKASVFALQAQLLLESGQFSQSMEALESAEGLTSPGMWADQKVDIHLATAEHHTRTGDYDSAFPQLLAAAAIAKCEEPAISPGTGLRPGDESSKRPTSGRPGFPVRPGTIPATGPGFARPGVPKARQQVNTREMRQHTGTRGRLPGVASAPGNGTMVSRVQQLARQIVRSHFSFGGNQYGVSQSAIQDLTSTRDEPTRDEPTRDEPTRDELTKLLAVIEQADRSGVSVQNFRTYLRSAMGRQIKGFIAAPSIEAYQMALMAIELMREFQVDSEIISGLEESMAKVNSVRLFPDEQDRASEPAQPGAQSEGGTFHGLTAAALLDSAKTFESAEDIPNKLPIRLLRGLKPFEGGRVEYGDRVEYSPAVLLPAESLDSLTLGIQVVNIDDVARRQLKIPERYKGVLVTAAENSMRTISSVHAPKLIMRISRHSISNVSELHEVSQKLRVGAGYDATIAIYDNKSAEWGIEKVKVRARTLRNLIVENVGVIRDGEKLQFCSRLSVALRGKPTAYSVYEDRVRKIARRPKSDIELEAGARVTQEVRALEQRRIVEGYLAELDYLARLADRNRITPRIVLSGKTLWFEAEWQGIAPMERSQLPSEVGLVAHVDGRVIGQRLTTAPEDILARDAFETIAADKNGKVLLSWAKTVPVESSLFLAMAVLGQIGPSTEEFLGRQVNVATRGGGATAGTRWLSDRSSDRFILGVDVADTRTASYPWRTPAIAVSEQNSVMTRNFYLVTQAVLHYANGGLSVDDFTIK